MPPISDTSRLSLAFRDLNAPVHLINAPELLPIIQAALPNWPVQTDTTDPTATPCMVITGDGDGRYLCKAADAGETKRWDAVNTVCEMIVELAWEQIRSYPSWLSKIFKFQNSFISHQRYKYGILPAAGFVISIPCIRSYIRGSFIGERRGRGVISGVTIK